MLDRWLKGYSYWTTLDRDIFNQSWVSNFRTPCRRGEEKRKRWKEENSSVHSIRVSFRDQQLDMPHCKHLQRSAKMFVRGCEKFLPALA